MLEDRIGQRQRGSNRSAGVVRTCGVVDRPGARGTIDSGDGEPVGPEQALRKPGEALVDIVDVGRRADDAADLGQDVAAPDLLPELRRLFAITRLAPERAVSPIASLCLLPRGRISAVICARMRWSHMRGGLLVFGAQRRTRRKPPKAGIPPKALGVFPYRWCTKSQQRVG